MHLINGAQLSTTFIGVYVSLMCNHPTPAGVDVKHRQWELMAYARDGLAISEANVTVNVHYVVNLFTFKYNSRLLLLQVSRKFNIRSHKL